MTIESKRDIYNWNSVHLNMRYLLDFYTKVHMKDMFTYLDLPWFDGPNRFIEKLDSLSLYNISLVGPSWNGHQSSD